MKLLLSFIALMTLSIAASASQLREYSEKDFNKEVYAGKFIILIFKSENCAVCDEQLSSIEQMLSISQYKDMKVFRIDFNLAKQIVKKFHVERTGTIILIKGMSEVYRSSKALTLKILETTIEKSLN